MIFASCSTFKETHYFKDDLKPTANYYKVDIKGYTFFSSSRYVSGYYDKGAVQAYFGELSQPKNGLFPASTNENNKNDSRKNEELVLLLSTNSDAIANSIGNLVKSKSVINSLSLITNKDKIEQSFAVDSEISLLDTEIDLFITKADTYLDIDTETMDQDQAKKRLLQFIKSELFHDADAVPLPDKFSDLYDWYLKNKK